MENQHRKIKGYRELNKDEINAMNSVKEVAAQVGDLVASMRDGLPDADQRWISIGATDLQKGFMALTRAVAKPDFF